MVQNDSECLILVISQMAQSFPTKVVQNNLECQMLLILHFFQSFPTKVVQNDSECLVLVIAHFSQSFPHQGGPKQFGMLNFDHFTLFPIFSHQSGLK